MNLSGILRAIADKLDADGYAPKVTPVWQPTGDPTLDFISLIMQDHRAVPTPERDANLARVDAEYGDAYFGGQFPVGSLTPADKAFLVRTQDTYGRDVWRDGIVAGGHLELAQASRDGEAWRNNYTDADANPALVAAVRSRSR